MMMCPKCRHEQNPANLECPKCGIVFEKYFRLQKARQNKNNRELNPAPDNDSFFTSVIMHTPDETNTLHLFGRCAVLLVIFVWGWTFILSSPGSTAAGNSFMHLIDLPFHEAGHIFFRPFGRLIASLGGTLGQLLMPCICLTVLLFKTNDPFGASVALWWLGQNFMDMAPYINDARSLTMPLLGGNTGDSSPYGFHDWQFILTELHLLKHDHGLAALSHGAGAVLMLTASLWGAAVLIKQYKNNRRQGG
jgi:hypothetical protein